MNSPYFAVLLQVVREHGGIDPLLRRGLEVAQVADLLSEAKAAGLILRTGSGLEVTESGMRLLGASMKRGQLGARGGWIRPLDEHRLPQLSPEEPFLPELPPRLHT